MDKQFILGTRKIDLQPGARIVRREELNVLYDADEIISKAAQAAERIEQKAQEDYQRRYEEGFAQGQEEGKSEYAMKIMEMVMTQLDSLEGLERQLTEVVISSVEKLIGTFDKQELAVRIVRKALAAVRGEKRVLVRVSLQDEPAVRADLQPFLLTPDGSSGYLEVRGDPALNQGDCMLETSLGVVEAGLSSQLALLSKALRERTGEQHGA